MTPPRTRIRIAAVAAVLALAPGCSLVLDFDDDTDAAPRDASSIDVVAPPWDAGADLYEPNDEPAAAIELEPGDYALTIAPTGDQDYWRLAIAERAVLRIDVRIVAGDDLDVELYSISELTEPLAWSRGTGDRERIDYAADPGVFVIRVYPFNGTGIAHYTLALSTEEGPQP